jgi:hypothetical protein
MSDQNVGSAQTQEASGPIEQTNQDKVAYETYKRVLSEAKKLKDQVRAFEEERNKGQENKLKEQNEWKALADSYKTQLDEKAKNLSELNEQVVNGLKFGEFEKHLGGRLRDKDYATFIDFDRIVLNPETKRVDDESVKGVVSDFVKKHSNLVDFDNGKRLPNEASSGSNNFSAGKKIDDMNAKELEEYIKTQHKAGLLK